MKKLDCFGDFCPVPLMRAQKEIKELAPGEELMLVTDHSCVVASIHEYFTLRKCDIQIDEVLNGVWEITIRCP